MSEWGKLRVAVLHPVLPDDAVPDKKRAIAEEHRALVAALLAHDVEILFLPIDPAEAYGPNVFARDPLHVVGNEAYCTRVNGRKLSELEAHKELFRQWSATPLLDLNGKLVHGGDVLLLPQKKTVIGEMFIQDNDDPYAEPVGDDALHFAQHLSQRGWHTEFVLHTMDHVDCAVAPLPDGSIWVQPTNLSPKTERNIQKLLYPHPVHPIPSHKPLAPNMLWLDPGTVITSDADTAAALTGKGYEAIHIPLHAIERMAGSVRCCVGVLVRDDV